MQSTIDPENHHLITKDRLEAVSRPLHAADGHRSVLRTARAWQACRIEQDANLIDQPTLIVWGERDRVIPIHNGEKLHQEILNSRFIVFKNCGHVPQEEQPGNFVGVVSEFCRRRKKRVEAGES
jgi:pimeloyl-ACP methyl ester carboxylesterase